MVGFKSWSLVAGIIALLLVGGIVLSTTSFVDREPTHAVSINSGTTYYVNGGNYYTRSISETYYRCTNSQHSGSNNYTSPLPSSEFCYADSNGDRVTCYTCDGSGAIETGCSTCNGTGSVTVAGFTRPCSRCDGDGVVFVTCSTCGGTGVVRGVCHNFSVSYYVYTYRNIETGGTIETSTSYSTATKYYVRFNANGGSGSMSNQYFLYGHSQAINANAFTRQGYTFLGWSTNSQATSATYSNGQSVTGIVSSGSTTLYAIWRQDAITVTAQVNNSNYGRVVGGGSYTPGTLVALTAIANDGYAFVEWQDSSGTAVSYEPTFTFTPNANVTYTAIFREVAVIITTSTGGGEIAVQETSGTDVAQTYMVRLNDNNYISYMMINDVRYDVSYASGEITNVPACLGIEYMVYYDGSQIYFNIVGLNDALEIVLYLSNAPRDLVSGGGGMSIDGVAIQSTFGGSATVVGSTGDSIILAAKVAAKGYNFVGWYDANTGDLISAEISATFDYETIEGKVIEARFEPIDQTNLNDQTNNAGDSMI